MTATGEAEALGNIDTIAVKIHLNARMNQMYREGCFEEPLDEVLQSSNAGMVVDGDTQFRDGSDEIASCNVDVILKGLSDEALRMIIDTLEDAGAPKGSKLVLPNGHEDIAFGTLEGMAIIINGSSLSAEVRDAADIDQIVDRLSDVIVGTGELRGHWETPEELALYFYGADFVAMKSATADILTSEPLCANSLVVQIA